MYRLSFLQACELSFIFIFQEILTSPEVNKALKEKLAQNGSSKNTITLEESKSLNSSDTINCTAGNESCVVTQPSNLTVQSGPNRTKTSKTKS